jgi:UDP-N-acetylglucosamine 2-epimerase (non-hydrolysing)
LFGIKKALLIVAGTRPEVIKLAPLLKWLERLDLEYVFVWSGQHYDYELSRIFFEQLKVPEPHENLDVRSGTHADQTAKVMVGLEKLTKKYSPSVLVAEGDTNTVVASSLTALKCTVPFAHVEAGLRSWNMCMPEEINRRIADIIATLHFAPTELAAMNLLFEGVSSKCVHLTGNTIVDVVSEYESLAKKRGEELLPELGLEKNGYFLVTVHRAENTDNIYRLANIVTPPYREKADRIRSLTTSSTSENGEAHGIFRIPWRFITRQSCINRQWWHTRGGLYFENSHCGLEV